jgi:hypothetical protein
VVEGGRLPTFGSVAGGAFLTKLASVWVVWRVAGKAILRRPGENALAVTLLTGDCGVLADEGKGG